MAEAVLDASAILALVGEEPGAEAVARIIANCIVSTVNGSEAIAKLVERGVPSDVAEEIIFGLPFELVDFDRPLAAAAGRMWPRGRRAGLSLGDRACLALAEAKSLPAVTADTQWRRFESSTDIKYIR